MHDSAMKKVLAISDCTNVCFIAEDLLYCVWKGMLHVNFPAISSLLHIGQILALSWKIWPPQMACRGHFGLQAEFSGWNTGVGLHVNFPAISSLLHIGQILALSWKIWPPKMACRGHFGPQAEFSGWNTGVGHYLNLCNVKKLLTKWTFKTLINLVSCFMGALRNISRAVIKRHYP